MPWLNELEPDEPIDLENVSEGAERIRELKRAIIERLSTAFKGFPGEDPDRAGEALLFPIAGAQVGTLAQRPDNPDREGHVWIATDTGEYFYGDRDGVWQVLPATDTEVSPDDAALVKTAFHDLQASVGNREATPNTVVEVLVLTPLATNTDANGHVVIDLAEHNQKRNNLIPHATRCVPRRSTGGTVYNTQLAPDTAWPVGTEEVVFLVYDPQTGNVFVSAAVEIEAMLFFKAPVEPE